ncbi:DNA polymerase Y family protein [Ruminiclostridium cellulolyticum]|uniref:DNA polymerase IV n=1 Tax=Ruminiclostridium cellulolyticum (strain ATCC 35319 / DSM 5812 / JCM 6584 / H10) TaxID=394503 RepID=B8I3L1_RUMCH|nr:DNA polymerase IV [Ruminiclostridium cellulolyticum]ACL76354.1 UMUC domain protein DNA-repair protein [Ruminiclostridium cellulolyticum H10]
MDRVILHCDLNNFYASVECLYNPQFRDYPLAVCGSQDLRHGIVLAKNYIAKKFGIKTGEAIWQAKQKCPNLVVVNPNYALYLRFSKDAREIYSRYSNLVESFGIDECWIDVSESTKLFGDGEKIANEIRALIKTELGVTASVGVSFNKIFAKLGSDLQKSNATTVINQNNFKEMVWNLNVGELLYVGRSTRKKLNQIGIMTIGDLAGLPPSFIRRYLGKWGEILWNFANGMDYSEVTATDYHETIKGIGNSMTTARDLVNTEDVKLTFTVLAESVAERLRKHNLKGSTIQIYIRDNELASIERQAKLPVSSYISGEITRKAMNIFNTNWSWYKPIRSLGIRATDLVTADSHTQLSFFDNYNKRPQLENLEFSIDAIRKRFGHYSVQRAILLKDSALNANPIEDNIIHPVSFFR